MAIHSILIPCRKRPQTGFQEATDRVSYKTSPTIHTVMVCSRAHSNVEVIGLHTKLPNKGNSMHSQVTVTSSVVVLGSDTVNDDLMIGYGCDPSSDHTGRTIM